MKRLAFTLDEVIRKTTYQFGKTYKKYVNPDIDLGGIEFTTNSTEKLFDFDTHEDYVKFTYEDNAFDIFAEAGFTEKNLPSKLALWQMGLVDEDTEEPLFDILLTNPYENLKSIGCTYFFLSKLSPYIRKVFLPTRCLEIWDACDVLVTAEPKLLENKPEGKIAIKIETDYNKDCPSDYTYGSISEFLDDNEIIEKIK